jgi:hypothetical protein
MRVLGVGTSAELDGLVACVERAVEPTEESVNVWNKQISDYSSKA